MPEMFAKKYWELAVLKISFFCFIPIEIRHKLWDRMDGTQFLWLSWFLAQKIPPQTFLRGVQLLSEYSIEELFWGGGKWGYPGKRFCCEKGQKSGEPGSAGPSLCRNKVPRLTAAMTWNEMCQFNMINNDFWAALRTFAVVCKNTLSLSKASIFETKARSIFTIFPS